MGQLSALGWTVTVQDPMSLTDQRDRQTDRQTQTRENGYITKSLAWSALPMSWNRPYWSVIS